MNESKIIFSEQKIILIDENNQENELKFSISNNILIESINCCDEKYVSFLLNKLLAYTYYHEKNYINTTPKDLREYHFHDVNDVQVIKYQDIQIKRFVTIGNGKTGAKNNICDVPGVKVGHFTVDDLSYHTGVTVISPHDGNIFREKVVASSYVYNGFGKSIGLVQIEELGTIETNIVLTTTMNVPKIADGVITQALNANPEIGVTTGTINPIVLECNDGILNNSRDRVLGEASYDHALEHLADDFRQGDIGAGRGMICHGYKGGIGSASRVVMIDGVSYTIGILVNSNFGSPNGRDLIFKGRWLGPLLEKHDCESEEKGSIVGVMASDLPLNERQIKRVIKRMEIGIGRTGSYAGHGSGDLFVGFTTSNKRKHFNDEVIEDIQYFNDNNLSQIFKLVCEATEEAVINSLLFSHQLNGYQKEIKSLNEANKIFFDLLDEEIVYKRS